MEKSVARRTEAEFPVKIGAATGSLARRFMLPVRGQGSKRRDAEVGKGGDRQQVIG